MFSFYVDWFVYHYEQQSRFQEYTEQTVKISPWTTRHFNSWKNENNYQTLLSLLQNTLNAVSSVAVFLGIKPRSALHCLKTPQFLSHFK